MESQVIAKIEALVSDNYELRKLWDEHQDLEKRLGKMTRGGKPLAPKEEAEVAELRKRKLAGKDRIFSILKELESA